MDNLNENPLNEINENTNTENTEIVEQNQNIKQSYTESLLNSSEIEDLNTLYSTFDDIISAIYFAEMTSIPVFNTPSNTTLDIMIILNDKFDSQNNKLVYMYINNYKLEHLDTRFNFIIRFLNDPVEPLFHIEGEKLPLRTDIYMYHFMNNLDPICGEKLNFNMDLISLADSDYVTYLFSELVTIKNTLTLDTGSLSYTQPLCYIILSTYYLLNKAYMLTAPQMDIVYKAWVNSLNEFYYNKFKEDFYKLLKKYDIDF